MIWQQEGCSRLCQKQKTVIITLFCFKAYLAAGDQRDRHQGCWWSPGWPLAQTCGQRTMACLHSSETATSTTYIYIRHCISIIVLLMCSVKKKLCFFVCFFVFLSFMFFPCCLSFEPSWEHIKTMAQPYLFSRHFIRNYSKGKSDSLSPGKANCHSLDAQPTVWFLRTERLKCPCWWKKKFHLCCLLNYCVRMFLYAQPLSLKPIMQKISISGNNC